MTVAFADIGKGNITMKTIFVEGIVAVIVADTGEKEMWEISDICPEVYASTSFEQEVKEKVWMDAYCIYKICFKNSSLSKHQLK